MKDRIYQIGEPVIRAKSKKVVDPRSLSTRQLIKKMIRVMRKEDLVGIAAPQVGVNQRVFITQPRSTKFRVSQSKVPLLVYINPRIIKNSKLIQIAYEGCGSVAQAGIFGKVARPRTVTIKAQDQLGNYFILESSGLLARIIQHEYDHLAGIVFLDHITNTHSLLDRASYIRKMR